MSKPLRISLQKAHQLVLSAQGLNGVTESPLETIRRLSYVQIDSIAVTARAHHHVLFSRNTNYQPQDLDSMLQQGEVFEYWSHAAAFLPIEDYRYSLYLKSKVLKEDKFWFDKDKQVMRQVMRRIKKEGPLQSKDFVHKEGKSGGWFEWKPAKIALQQLFMEGRLMIHSRQGFQKVFDLTERVLPEGIDTRKPTEKGFYTYLCDRAISAQGLVTAKEIGYLRKASGPPIARVLKEKLRQKGLLKVAVEGIDEEYYSHPESLDLALENHAEEQLFILNPFDNLVIQRKRLWDLFHFDYQIECYVPAAKRKYGYYTLPVLYQGRFVARLDAKAERKERKLVVKQVWLEAHFQPGDHFTHLFAQKLRAFACFCGCEQIVVEKASPYTFRQPLQVALDG